MSLRNRIIHRDLLKVGLIVARGWMKGNYAVDARGRTVNPDSPRAVKLCIIGAIQRVTQPFASQANLGRFFMVEGALEEHLPKGFRTLSKFNNSPRVTKADVLACIDRALQATRREM